MHQLDRGKLPRIYSFLVAGSDILHPHPSSPFVSAFLLYTLLHVSVAYIEGASRRLGFPARVSL